MATSDSGILGSIVARLRARFGAQPQQSEPSGSGQVLAEDERAKVFDADFYLRRYPDVAAAGIPAWEHYLSHGARENRQPHPLFDPTFYLERYEDVARAGIDPFEHYLAHGWRESRQPARDVDVDWYWLMYQEGRAEAGDVLSDYSGRSERESLELAPFQNTPRYIDGRLADKFPAVVDRIANHEASTMRAVQFLIGRKCLVSAERLLRARMERTEKLELQVVDTLVKALDAQSKHWQVVDALKLSLKITPNDSRRYFAMGEQYEKMFSYKDAVAAYQNALEIGGSDSDVHYRCGYAAEKAGDIRLAERSYRSAVAGSSIPEVRRFGVGYLHERRGLWREAAAQYVQEVERSGGRDAELHYRLGYALDRCYDWSQARGAYVKAISLDSRIGNWHYRAGLASERLEKFEEAAAAYAAAAFYSGKTTRTWSYRQAVCLVAIGSYRRACDAFMQAWGDHIERQIGRLPDDEARAELLKYAELVERDTSWTEEACRARGIRLLKLGLLREAARDFKAAIQRCNEFDPGLHALHGYSLLLQDRHEEACQAFLMTSIYRAAYGVSADGYEKNQSLRTVMRYNEYRETLPILDKTIVYQSFGGTSVSCNPLALFRSLRERFKEDGWLHVWLVSDMNVVPDQYRDAEDVIFVPIGSDLHLRYLACAKYLINNATFPPWFIRRDEQRYLNTWHGTPLKTLGRDMRGRLLEHKTFTRNLLHATHVISPNPHTTEIITRTNETQGLLTARVAETGYPRIDLTLDRNETRVAALKARLGIQPSEEVVLYAPTWRGEHGAIRMETDRLLDDLEAMKASGRKILFRGHALTEEILVRMDLDAYLVPKDVDTNELLSIVDTLVTDYSSVFFDFLPLRRRVVLYVYDLEAYVEERGLYFSIDEMPGTICHTREQMRDALGADIPLDKVDAGIQKFCASEDGCASTRALQFFLDDDDSCCVPQERTRPVLIYAGDFLANGITSSCLNLTSALCENGQQVVMAVEPDVIAPDPVRVGRFAELSSQVQVIGRYGRMLLSPEEKWLLDRFNTHYSVEPAQMQILATAYRREFLRTFGCAEFSAIVEFEGYIRFWMCMFAFGGSVNRRIAYLHNDMLKEFTVRFPYLKAIFALYHRFDALVSVSETMAKVNAESLSEPLGIDKARFVHCDNIIDSDTILRKADQQLDPDLQDWIGDSFAFVTMGRLSPEKDQSKLIDAFHDLSGRWPRAKLVIAGDGPLKIALTEQIERLGLQGRVLLAGLRENPFPLLKRADCFVLSSNHEGQPMVLLEAMVLEKPIVATDIDGNRGLLRKYDYGYLVENHREGLVEGLEDVLGGDVPSCHFSVVSYREQALSQFIEVVKGSSVTAPCDQISQEIPHV